MNKRDKELYEQAEKYADVEFKGEGGAVWVEAFESKFAELIRADERDRAMRENAYVQFEREACAVIAETKIWAGGVVAAAIRARGNT